MIRPEFGVHMLNEAGVEKARSLAEAFSVLLETVDILVPASRERSIVVTKLQEACFYAKRGIAVLPENQK